MVWEPNHHYCCVGLGANHHYALWWCGTTPPLFVGGCGSQATTIWCVWGAKPQLCFGGGFGGIASGTFRDCVSGASAFGGGGGSAEGIFTNCTGGSISFGRFGTLTGSLYYCRLTGDTFETVSAPGVTRLCIDGSNVENNQG